MILLLLVVISLIIIWEDPIQVLLVSIFQSLIRTENLMVTI